METLAVEFDDPQMPLRDYQRECVASVERGWKEAQRQLVVLAGGCGKTIVAAHLAKSEVANGGRVLFLAHTDELLEQAIDKFTRAVGIVPDKEKADRHASPESSVVVASIQTLSRQNRLTTFPPDHFSLVIIDETHRVMADSYQRVIGYFRSRLLGITATANRGDKRSLGEIYQRVAYEYGLLEAVRDGYLVRPIVKNVPLQIDLRGIKVSRTGQGSDFDLLEVSDRIHPILREVAKQLAIHARPLKTVVFTPSVQTARELSAALVLEGIPATFVSGECKDRDQKVEAFRNAPQGTFLVNALLVVEGFDVPDITGVCILRPTKIWSFFVQCSMRGSRTITGTIDGITDKAMRLRAIADSIKPQFTLIDFLWLTDRIDLIQPVDLVTTNPKIREQLVALEGDDLVANQAVAERNMLKALAAEARRHARRQARVIDPIAMSVAIGDAALASWEPETAWDSDPPTPGQLSFLAKNGIDVTKVRFKGYASKLIWRVIQRLKLRLATVRQLSLLAQFGVDEQQSATLTIKEASALIDKLIGERRDPPSGARTRISP